MEASSGLDAAQQTLRSRLNGNKFRKLKNNDDSSAPSFEINTDKNEKSEDETSRSEKLMETANKVEGMFIGMMLKRMRETVKKTKGMFSDGPGAKMFREKLDNKYANRIAEARKIGIAEKLYNQYASQFNLDPKPTP